MIVKANTSLCNVYFALCDNYYYNYLDKLAIIIN